MSPLPDIGVQLRRAPDVFKRVRHIEYFEGPLLSEFHGAATGDSYLLIWRASDDDHNRWLAIRTTKRDIALYEMRRVTLLALMERAVGGYLVDVDAAGKFVRWWAVVVDQLPADYLPTADSFFDPDLRPPGAANARRGQAILIEGQWELQDLTEYPRRFRDVYSAEYLLSADAQHGARQAIFEYWLRGGFAYKTFFSELAKAVPAADQAKLRTFQYASPGIIEMDLNEGVAAAVARRVLELSPVIEEANEIYREIFRWLQAQGKDAPAGPRFVHDHDAALMVRELCELMGFVDFDRVARRTVSLQQTAKIVLACYRRIKTLWQYHESGKAKLVLDVVTVADLTVTPAGDIEDDDDTYDGDDEDLEGDPSDDFEDDGSG